MSEHLVNKDLDIIIESLSCSLDRVRNNTHSYEERAKKIKELEMVLAKIRLLKKEWD